ncbi:MAG: hypothetical protein ABSA41_21065 [Terriglobia bacterium]
MVFVNKGAQALLDTSETNGESTVNMSEMVFRIYDACDGRGIPPLPDSPPHKVSICDTAWNLLWEVLRRKWLLRVLGNKNIQWGELES